MNAACIRTIICGFLIFTAPLPVKAEVIQHNTDYNISLGPLTIARAKFATRMDGTNYTISGTFNSAGLASVLKDISGTAKITGSQRGNRMQASSFDLVYNDGKRTRSYDVKFRNGDVISSVITPKPKSRPDGWVAVKPRDLRSVLDPISGLIFPSSAKMCPSVLPVYDGESRMDLVFSDAGTRKFKTKGFDGEVIVCTIRYVPKSGYRHGRKDIEYLKSIRMEVWFGKSDVLNVYAPVYAKIPTRLGQVHITASRFGN